MIRALGPKMTYASVFVLEKWPAEVSRHLEKNRVEKWKFFFCFHSIARPMIRALGPKMTCASVFVLEKCPVEVSRHLEKNRVKKWQNGKQLLAQLFDVTI